MMSNLPILPIEIYICAATEFEGEIFVDAHDLILQEPANCMWKDDRGDCSLKEHTKCEYGKAILSWADSPTPS